MIKLYHGSNVRIDNIDLSCSRRGKDFGCGFYLNPDKSQAEQMAIRTYKRMMNKDIQFQIECLSTELIEMLMQKYDWNMKQAFDELYFSETFKRICNPECGLYYESPVYVFSYLENEIEKGVCR